MKERVNIATFSNAEFDSEMGTGQIFQAGPAAGSPERHNSETRPVQACISRLSVRHLGTISNFWTEFQAALVNFSGWFNY